MRLFGGFGLGRWFGFEIRIDYSWFLIFFLVVWTLSTGHFPAQMPGGSTALYYAMGTAAALLVFLSVLLHELSHSAVARTRGLEVEGITLFIFGGVARTRMEAKTAADEFLLTAAGPLASVLLGVLSYGIALLAEFLGWPVPVIAVAETLAFVNVGLAVFNMVPGFPLDGGRIFRSTVWHFTGDLEKATRWATRGGQAFGYLLVGYGVFLLWNGIMLEGLWAAFIGWFLSSAASSSWQQFRARELLSHVTVEQVMTREPVTLPATLPISAAVEEFFLRRPYTAYPVLEDGRVVGIVTLDHVSDVPAADRSVTSVAEVMGGVEEVPAVSPTDRLDEALQRLNAADIDRALVLDGDRLVGFVTLGEIAGWLDRAHKLGREDATSSPADRGGRWAPASVAAEDDPPGRARPGSDVPAADTIVRPPPPEPGRGRGGSPPGRGEGDEGDPGGGTGR